MVTRERAAADRLLQAELGFRQAQALLDRSDRSHERYATVREELEAADREALDLVAGAGSARDAGAAVVVVVRP